MANTWPILLAACAVLLTTGCEQREARSGLDPSWQGVVLPTAQRQSILLPEALPPLREVPDGHFDALLLSGGGQLGAYGAGLLEAWSDAGIPAFELITGISTGALQASHAFVHESVPGALPALAQRYRQITDAEVQRSRGCRLLSFLGRSSLKDLEPLRQTVDAMLSDEILRAVAAKHRDGRGRLFAVATNLDTAELVLFDLGTLASRYVAHLDRASGRLLAAGGSAYDPQVALDLDHRQADHAAYARLLKEHYIDAILASSAFPGFLAPIAIGGDVYVDGGLQHPVYMDPGLALPPEGIAGQDHIWCLMNVALFPDAAMVDPEDPGHRIPYRTRPRILDVIVRSSMIMNKRMNLYHLALLQHELGDEYRIHYAFIEETAYNQLDNPFNPELDPARQEVLYHMVRELFARSGWQGRTPGPGGTPQPWEVDPGWLPSHLR